MVRADSKTLLALLMFALVVASAQTHAADPFRRSGFRLDPSDYALLGAAAEKLYLVDSVEVGTVEAWDNPETGNHGTVRLMEKHEYQGMPCRLLQHDIEVKRTRDPYRFTVDRCKTGDGEWKILTR